MGEAPDHKKWWSMREPPLNFVVKNGFSLLTKNGPGCYDVSAVSIETQDDVVRQLTDHNISKPK